MARPSSMSDALKKFRRKIGKGRELAEIMKGIKGQD